MASINDFMMPQFHKLNGKNYPVWKQKMEQALSYYGLWEIVTGATPKPDLMSNSYTYENKTALRFLTFALEDDILPHIRNINTAVDVWMKLKSLYETSNELRISFLRNKLTGLKMESSDFITDHIQKLQELKNELSAIDSDIKDKEFITILFNSLPNEYQNFVISFGVSSQKETPTFEETVGLLLQEEQRLQKNDFSEPDRDFTGRHRGSGQAPRGGHSWHPNWIQNSSNQIDSFQNSNQTDTFQSTNQSGRFGEIVRVTKETNVQVKINLDGSGISDCNTGIPFLDHMLDQIASHGIIDMQVKARGDIHIDDHHTNEDVALAFGSSLLQALGDKKGIYRFGDFSAPLDEALVHVALDLSGRPYLGYNLCIPSQRVGTYDTQLVEHFFQSLVNTSGMTLHIRQLAGKNSHHIIEATFKAFARALRQATEYDTRRSGGIPSSKGVLSRT